MATGSSTEKAPLRVKDAAPFGVVAFAVVLEVLGCIIVELKPVVEV